LKIAPNRRICWGRFWGTDLARKINRLSARGLPGLAEPGRYADGNGLYLSISENGGRRWVFLYRRHGKHREMGLGSARSVSLADARELASGARQALARGLDPIEARQEAKGSLSFEECAKGYIADNRAGWSNAKHADQWTNTLKQYVYPTIGHLPASEVATSHVTKILNSIWTEKTETASRVRSRIEAVLDWAKVKGYRHGENPARWRGHLDQILPKRSKVQRVEHHPALPFGELPAFVKRLRGMPGTAPRALEFTILTIARTNETLGATIPEIDIGAAVWSVPNERMKGRRDHRVPLPARAIEILEDVGIREGDNRKAPVFCGMRSEEPLNHDAMLVVLDRMNMGHVTVHGFRSTFRDWAGETTHFPNEVVEMALAHTIPNKSEAAYRRGDLFEKRRELMNAWAEYCGVDGEKERRD
jgi:integrase